MELAKDRKEPGKFVEPALPTPKDKLNHFRLCGEDKKWHPAEAKIVGDLNGSGFPKVPIPIRVQYAYSAVPEQSNLYNKAVLPATPFALINKRFIFEEDDLEKAAALKAKYARWTDPDYPILQVAKDVNNDGVILQRNQPIRIWGHVNKGVELTVSLDGDQKKVRPNELEQWEVSFPPRQASNCNRLFLQLNLAMALKEPSMIFLSVMYGIDGIDSAYF